MTRDYKDTVFLPKTDFPMRAGLPQKEPEILQRWQDMKLFDRLRQASKGREKYVLHDGPPYANGHLHMGHALNKVLKDVINRSQQMLGKDAHYVPGWDCHGLPIEWKVEEGYRAEGKDKDAVDKVKFRRQCRAFAEKWIKVQTDEFQRLGVLGNWAKPYTTMAFKAEAAIVREIGKFLLNGSLYAGAKPVLWSVVEKTALADAEVEYHDHKSITLWVRFPVVKASHAALNGASIVIWTTTPWTLPGNRAIAYAEAEDYVVFEAEYLAPEAVPSDANGLSQELKDAASRLGVALEDYFQEFKKIQRKRENRPFYGRQKFVVAAKLLDSFKEELDFDGSGVVATLKGAELAGSIAAHPLRGQGYDFDVPLLPGDFVTMDTGTGFVHIAPGHGEDDWELGLKFGIAIPQTVGGDGLFLPHVPLFAGASVYDQDGKQGTANVAVIRALAAAGAMLHKASLLHSYPHSWRSKAPLIFRNTPQWFISMEKNGLRDKALKAIDATRFVPPGGKNRLGAMIAQRPDWCISRQRLWGTPLPLFVDKKSGEPLRDAKVIERIAQAVESEGGDTWFSSPPERWLGNDYNAADFEQIKDVVEVWFDSGSTHAFVLEERPELKWPADLYLEGSDQHRGWFHTSLLESAGTRGRAPYDAVLTHGFVLDEKGHKMSKSLGNVIAPQDIIAESGADILRLWVVASDYGEDIRIGKEIMKQQVEAYRRLRNTLRYLLGALDGFSDEERTPPEKMPELERWVLHRLAELDLLVRKAIGEYDFHAIYRALHDFAAGDLSAFYFDIRKDALYCEKPDSDLRRACRTVLDQVFSCLTAWLAPILCFTTEEAWWARGAGPEQSVHERLFPTVPDSWLNPDLAQRWEELRRLRRVVTGALELARAEKKIGASLQAAPHVHVEDSALLKLAEGYDLAELCLTSGFHLLPGAGPADAFRLAEVPGIAVEATLASGEKCQRCWRVKAEVAKRPTLICDRCDDAVAAFDKAAE